MNPIRSSQKVHADRPSPSETTWGRCTGNRKRKEKASTTPALPTSEDEDSKTRNLLPYILPRWISAPKFKIPKQTWAMPIAPLVPKGVKVLMDIMSNLWKLSFVDHDKNKHKELDCQNYMDTVQDTPYAPKWFVVKEWVRGLEQYDILSLLHMPHFGHSIPIVLSSCFYSFMVGSYSLEILYL